ncbi:MAG: cysteine--tRNA ligase [Fretibacterium sp.]|nr:cysteine--tRNA ligase [Fretibacterium sp.]
MSLTLYNDLTRKKEPFVPLKEGEVSFYSCGPTVYDYFHIGNARPFIVFDVLRRYLEHQGYKVTFVQNFTDIDDKMIHRAHREGITVPELAERFIAEYRKDAGALGIHEPTVAPRATEHIPEIIDTIRKIIDNGHAYVSGGDVYFDVKSWPKYGVLCKQNLDDLEAGARVEPGEVKRDPLDFALWKGEKPGEPAWDSPWGRGRPGWHIECSAMSSKYLGETIDIHSGGVDLLFPHHENEVAQSEAATGKQFVRYWLHNGFLLIDSEKMSKSLGNFLTARAALEKYSPLAIRLFMLSAHYRSPINFAPEGLQQAAAGVTRLRNCRGDLDFAAKNRAGDNSGFDMAALTAGLEKLDADFHTAMDDDFNTAAALGVLFEVVHLINTSLKDHEVLPPEFFEVCRRALDTYDGILGVIGPDEAEEGSPEDAEIEKLIEERAAARKAKNFARSDEIRDQLRDRGIVLEDTPQGTKWKREI